MTQYNILNLKLSNLQINKLKSGIKNGTEVTFRISLNFVGDSNDEKSFLIKLSKTQFYKITQSWGFLGILLWPLLKTRSALIRNLLKPLAKSILIPLGSTAAAAATDAAIHKNILVQVVILWTLLFIQTFKETGDSQYIYIYISKWTR